MAYDNGPWEAMEDAARQTRLFSSEGRVEQVLGLVVEGRGLKAGIGSLVTILASSGRALAGEVVGFREGRVVVMPYGDIAGVCEGDRIRLSESEPAASVGDGFLGRVVDGLGHPIDGKGPLGPCQDYPLYGKPINPMQRRAVDEFLDVGISAINLMTPVGRGQRVAIMAGSGVGKSVLMGMMTRYTEAEVVIIGLIGERGREVKDFVDKTLGKEGMERAVVVAATSDSPPLVRMRGAYQATALAEYFRDQGKDVLLIIDSITRFAMSSRDVGLSAGEAPTNRGYTSSFFVKIPVLLERAGAVEGKGSITGFYTTLVEGDDMNDPVGDTVRSIVDGHIVLSRDLANRGHYPAIEVLGSVSRVASDVVGPEHLALRSRLQGLMSTYRQSEDMIAIGAYNQGSNAQIDEAIALKPKIDDLLRQNVEMKCSYGVSLNRLKALFMA
ncbi:FliI/YscN family ATPase [Desulfoluna spongiiphila]|uniref:Type III secretion system ATPase, FliI/YscN n=1 Tax=Desulfoluna spongiiphila TaxID=419481 RepID=A0A1G5IX15_9BACT|nr:FliI/YscN family ATPase [Desulfoluna spongiiphila]SCY80645.1 type III secretion system ATPase, FliI/YscN [Desulfoluna spongiiphila]VVS93269.1 atpase type iii secretion system flii/yscn [Desulfoluna spongiiphila]